jgi:UDP-GlcNAc:undecaprenyl-phosphate GlcNAc-1-phosphate transferase
MPDGRRRIHTAPTARMGGLAVAAAFFVATIVARKLLLFSADAVAATSQDTAASMRATGKLLAIWPYVIPSLIILATGVCDDIVSLRPRVKLLLQLAAAFAFYIVGWRIERILGVRLPAYLSCDLTMLWLVACANAVNLFDGMDGLASGIGILTSGMILVLASYMDKGAVAVFAAALGGACLGFLLFNFPPARVFLGDTGSLFIGMLLGELAISGSFKSHLTFAILIPILGLGLPMMDMLLTVVRRAIRRVPLFGADRDHIHHRLIATGFTRGQALALLYGVSILLTSLALIIAFSNNLTAGLLIVAIGVVILIMARLLAANEVHALLLLMIGRGNGATTLREQNAPDAAAKSTPSGAAEPPKPVESRSRPS